ncbi:MAG: 1-acyl-sn-glycerol-3-phosphate acyltransferase [Deltaproteobacteria bacterium]|nr:1-acyl-sn-glycerol-3-phosphate acyltransferase [Deltaproteobacteria bacterium]MCB9788362.1 1-acyl-sn-glycerol-3-phosphate acyltransferase [Deltaproteobacteria bacterium]
MSPSNQWPDDPPEPASAPAVLDPSQAAPRPSEAAVSEALLAEARLPARVPPPRRFPDLEGGEGGSHLSNPGRMLSRLGLTWRTLLHLVFRRVAFDERYQRMVRETARDADVVFVMNHHSLLDYLYFNYAFLRFGLPLVFFVNGISLRWMRPLWRIVLAGLRRLIGRRPKALPDTDLLSYGLERGRPALIFLKRRGLWPWSPDLHAVEYLETVIEAQLARQRECDGRPECEPRPLVVIPQLLVWSQNPNRYRRTMSDLVFGNPEAPGRVRKALSFVINRSRAFVQMGQPIDLGAFIAEQADDLSVADLARKLRFACLQALSVEERVIKGPILKDAKRIRQEILRTPEMQAEIRRLAAEGDRTNEEVTKQVDRYLDEMAADFSMAYIEGMCLFLTVLFDRMYSEVIADSDGLERVREAARTAPLILLPCHRSHVDYLVISYLFYANGLIPPHIAAGDNLKFFPVGHIFRRSGAFFIRRSFKENPAYRATFRHYLRKLVREGYWIEFFPEGGRSRTGKMLPPKYGVLATILDAVKGGATHDVKLVPIYVGYEQVIEERAYTQELSGGEKKKENITGLLKTTKVLWSRYGRLYVRFGEPLSVREQMDIAQVGDSPNESPEYQLFVRRMGYRVLDGIQDVALVTPSAVTAMALLTHPKRGVAKEVLLRRIGFLLGVASQKQAALSKSLEHALKIRRPDVAQALEEAAEQGLPPEVLALGAASPVARARGLAVQEAVEPVLERYLKEKYIEARTFEDDVVYTLVDDQRVNLDFYKNNIVHLLIPEAILAAAVRGTWQDRATDEHTLRDVARFLSKTFKYEFIYDPDRSFDQQFDATLESFERAGILVRVPGDDDAVERLLGPAEDDPRHETLLYLHQICVPWIESYWLLATGILETVDEEIPEKDLLKKLQRMSRRRFHEGDVRCLEAASTVTFKQALEACVELGYVARVRRGRDSFIRRLGGTEGAPDPLLELTAELHRFIGS